MDGKNQQILIIFLASVLSTPLYHCVMPIYGRIPMYDVHRFDARKILWRMGIQLKKYTTFYYMTLSSFM